MIRTSIIVAIASLSATAAFAGSEYAGCNYGHSATASVATEEPQVAQSLPATTTTTEPVVTVTQAEPAEIVYETIELVQSEAGAETPVITVQ